MTPNEVIDLLSIIAGYDRRTVGQVDVEAWRLALDDPRIPNLAYGECVDAVILHYRDTTDFVMPSHILSRVKADRATGIARIMPSRNAEPARYDNRIHGMWAVALKEARERQAANRIAVLRHPDLAARLTEPPLSYAKPEQWNGGIPPETFGGERNDSGRRAALVELVEDAARREKGTAA